MPQYFRQLLRFSRPAAVLVLLLIGCSVGMAQTKQEHIHHMGPSVMPFDLAKTTHVFHMTDTGGVQCVIAKYNRLLEIEAELGDAAAFGA
jgi:hypothetical protein